MIPKFKSLGFHEFRRDHRWWRIFRPSRYGARGKPQQDVTRIAEAKRQSVAGFYQFLLGGDTPPWPLEVLLEVSNLCNLRCAMCGVFSAIHPFRNLRLSEVERGFYEHDRFAPNLQTVLDHALVVHAFGFGEPTIHPNFKQIVQSLANAGVFVDFVTNGMKLDKDFCEFLVDSRVGNVCVSVSGATAADYENVYLGGDFNQVLGGIRRLRDARDALGARFPRIHVNSIGFEHHIAKLVEFVELMAASGAEHIFVKQASPDIEVMNHHISVYRPWLEKGILDCARRRGLELGISIDTSAYESTAVASEEEWQQTKQRLSGRAPRVELTNIKQLAKDIPHIPGVAPTAVNPCGPGEPESEIAERLGVRPPEYPARACLEPFKTMYVHQQGTVKPCCFSNGVPALGDVSLHDAEKVWRGAGYRTVRNGILDGKYPMKLCDGCIRNDMSPRHHGLGLLADVYQQWFRHAFGQDFLSETELQQVKDAPVNEGAVRNRTEPRDAS
jgi:MoaA/NifB/PqqE/SkfB family radical SAM enzyme